MPPKGYARSLDHASIDRLEGKKEKDRRPPAPERDIIQAAARAYGEPEKWLLGEEDRPPDPLTQAGLDEMQADPDSYSIRYNLRPASPELERFIAERTAVRRVMAAALGFANEVGNVPDKISVVALDVISQVEQLFWDAFDFRGLTTEELLKAARHLGLVVITPMRLPWQGFQVLTFDEADFREFWQLQLAAIRRLMRPAPDKAGKPEETAKRNRILSEIAERRREKFAPWPRHVASWWAGVRTLGDPGRLDFQYSRLDHDFAVYLNELIEREASALLAHEWSGDMPPLPIDVVCPMCGASIRAFTYVGVCSAMVKVDTNAGADAKAVVCGANYEVQKDGSTTLLGTGMTD